MQAKFGKSEIDITLKSKNPSLARDIIEHSRFLSRFSSIERLKIIRQGSFKIGRGKNEVIVDVWKSKPSLKFDTKAELSLIHPKREVYIPEWKITTKSKLFRQINIPRFEEVINFAEKPTFKPLLIPPFSLLFPSSSQSIKPISFRIGLPKLLDISIPKSFDISTPTIDQSPGIIDVTDVASLYRTNTDIAQSTTPIYDFVEEQIQPVKTTRKTRTRITPGEQDIFLPTIEFGFKPTPFSKIEMFAKGYRYRKWKVMKIEDLLFGR
ncbi:MAG: hypothetical protein DRN18_05030 [Thermoplasmata archaeon]|nr:MAG: hypothetical protein DRN18_05030 [Thermoplasmata archaeon]